MNYWMLSSCAVDPTLYVASDIHCKMVDVDNRMTSAMMVYKDDEAPDLFRHWSFDDRLNEDIDGDERFFPPRLLEQQQLSAVNWYHERSASPTFSSDRLDILSHDLWTLSPSSLLDKDDDAYGSKTLRTRIGERSVWGSYCSHTTSTSTDDACSASRFPSRGLSSVDVSSPTMTSGDGVDLAGSTPGSIFSSRSNSLEDNNDVDVVNHELPARVWKRRRRRRQRRWSRQSSLSTTSRAQRITRHLSVDCPVDHDAHILRSLLLHGSKYSSYLSPPQASTKSRPVTSGCHRRGRGGAATPKQMRRTISTPLIARRLCSETGNDAVTATIRRRYLEDHCYFNRKQEAMIDYSRISRCQTVRIIKYRYIITY